MAAADFKVGDLVWARMKNYPLWPGKIENPPSNTKSNMSKKAHHYVFFFGSENSAWISDKNIVRHSEEMLQSFSKKKYTFFKSAIDKIIAESEKVSIKNRLPVKEKLEMEITAESSLKAVPIKSRLPVKEKLDMEMPAESSPTTSSERKVSKSKKAKTKTLTAQKPYFAKFQKMSQNQYFAKMHKSVQNKCFTDKVRSSTSEKTLDQELNDEILLENLNELASVKYTNKKIGFFGVGKMGETIVKKLIQSNHDVTVWNRTIDKCKKFVELGARSALTPCNVIETCDITFCCVSGPEATEEIFSGFASAVEGFEDTTGKGYVELSTTDPITSKKNAEAIRNKGGAYLESPLSMSINADKSVSLVAVCAGDFELFSKCQSCFKAFTSAVSFIGTDVGSATVMNLTTNMFLNTLNAAMAQSLALVKKLNLNQDTFLEVLKRLSLNCRFLQHKGNSSDVNELFIGNTFQHQQKVLMLALTLGDSYAQPMPLTAAANELYKHPLDLFHEPENGESTSEDK